MASDNNLAAMADRLNLTFCRDHIEEIICETTNSRMNPREILQFVFSREISRREENRIRIGTMASFFVSEAHELHRTYTTYTLELHNINT